MPQAGQANMTDNVPCTNSLGSKLSVEDVSVRGKRVLMRYTDKGVPLCGPSLPLTGCRVDYNVPLTETGAIANDQRIVATLPTLKLLLERGARSIVLLSHLGRPEGQRVPSMSLCPVAGELGRLLGREVLFLGDCVGPAVEEACGRADDGAVILLENVRFHLEEEGSVKLSDGSKRTADPQAIERFRQSLTRLGDIYVNDAFGAAHRAHSSIVGIGLSMRVAGLLLKQELSYFARVLEGPSSLDLAILGGAKVSDKIQLIRHLLPKVRCLAIGGGMSFTFQSKLRKMAIGKSLFDEAGAAIVGDIVEEAKRLGVTLLLPEDWITGSAVSAGARTGYATIESGIPSDMMGLDDGPKSVDRLVERIQGASSILWNGPVGVYDVKPFEGGTKRVLEALVQATKRGALTIVGGGDSGAAVAKWNAQEGLSHVSTGGGASLELLEGKALPGIVALSGKGEGRA